MSTLLLRRIEIALRDGLMLNAKARDAALDDLGEEFTQRITVAREGERFIVWSFENIFDSLPIALNFGDYGVEHAAARFVELVGDAAATQAINVARALRDLKPRVPVQLSLGGI